jgi:hypothetical protein
MYLAGTLYITYLSPLHTASLSLQLTHQARVSYPLPFRPILGTFTPI